MPSNSNPFPNFHRASLAFDPSIPDQLSSAQLALAKFTPAFSSKPEIAHKIRIEWMARVDRAYENGSLGKLEKMGINFDSSEIERDDWTGFELLDTTFDVSDIMKLSSAQLALAASQFHPDATDSIAEACSAEWIRRRRKDQNQSKRLLPSTHVHQSAYQPTSTTAVGAQLKKLETTFEQPIPKLPSSSPPNPPFSFASTSSRQQLPTPEISEVSRGKRKQSDYQEIETGRAFVHPDRQSQMITTTISPVTIQVATDSFNEKMKSFTVEKERVDLEKARIVMSEHTHGIVPNEFRLAQVYISKIPRLITREELVMSLYLPELPTIMAVQIHSHFVLDIGEEEGKVIYFAHVSYETVTEAISTAEYIYKHIYIDGVKLHAKYNESGLSFWKWSSVTDAFREKIRTGTLARIALPTIINSTRSIGIGANLNAPLSSTFIPKELISTCTQLLLRATGLPKTTPYLEKFFLVNAPSIKCVGISLENDETAYILATGVVVPSMIKTMNKNVQCKIIDRPEENLHFWRWTEILFNSGFNNLSTTQTIPISPRIEEITGEKIELTREESIPVVKNEMDLFEKESEVVVKKETEVLEETPEEERGLSKKDRVEKKRKGKVEVIVISDSDSDW